MHGRNFSFKKPESPIFLKNVISAGAVKTRHLPLIFLRLDIQKLFLKEELLLLSMMISQEALIPIYPHPQKGLRER